MKMRTKLILLYAMLAATAGLVSSLDIPESTDSGAGAVPEDLIAVAPPPFSEGVFPCSDCHFEDDEVDLDPREVDFHDTVHFDHASDSRWCLDCHDAQNRDMLHLADGRLIPFEESYRLCGQCHAQQLRDWEAGDHGRRTGEWSGTKQYLLCAHCHDPHSPTFESLTPLPPPIRQEEIK